MPSSIKKTWWISLLCLWAHGSQSGFKGRFDTRVTHTRESLASHRDRFFLEQNYTNALLTLVGSFRAQTEGLAPGTPRSTVDLRDLYIGVKSSGLNLKLGWQQVVWGEAFGFYFADIINPKDLTELGLGDLEGNRLTVPMLNAKYISQSNSAQLVIIPTPMISRIPKVGSAFSFPYESVFADYPVSVSDTRHPQLALDNFEGGLRLSTNVRSTSLAGFYFYGFDRNPPSISTPAAGGFSIDRPFKRQHSIGISSSTDIWASVARTEFVFHADRAIQVISPGALASANASQMSFVLGFDRPMADWQFGVQGSVSHRLVEIVGSGARTTEQLSIRLAGLTTAQMDWEIITSYLFHDGSWLGQPKLTLPLSSQLELSLAADIFLGGASSEFGSFQRSSRVLAEFRAHLSS